MCELDQEYAQRIFVDHQSMYTDFKRLIKTSKTLALSQKIRVEMYTLIKYLLRIIYHLRSVFDIMHFNRLLLQAESNYTQVCVNDPWSEGSGLGKSRVAHLRYLKCTYDWLIWSIVVNIFFWYISVLVRRDRLSSSTGNYRDSSRINVDEIWKDLAK